MNVVDKLTTPSEQNKSILDRLNELINGESPETKSISFCRSINDSNLLLKNQERI